MVFMDELIAELKTQGVLKSSEIEAAFRAIDRADFVRPEFKHEAYGNYPLPIGEGQTISQPYTVAFMLELLDPQPGEKILDIGAGSGWQTALIAEIVSSGERAVSKTGHVIAIERISEICRLAEANLKKYNFIKKGVVELRCSDATADIPPGPFDNIIAAAAAEKSIPESWRQATRIGGSIVVPIGNSIWRFTKQGESQWDEEEFPGFVFVPLVRASSNQLPASSEKQHQGRTKKKGTLFVLSALLALLLAAGAYATFAPLDMPQERATVEIKPGMGSRMIASYLKSQGIVRSKWALVTYASITGNASNLKPGAYEFDGRLTIPAIVSQLVQGERYPNERFITIPEGWDLEDIGLYLESINLVSANDLWQVTGFPPSRAARKETTAALGAGLVNQFPFLGELGPSATLEGYLFPDSYRLYRDASPRDVATKMLANFERKLTPDLKDEIRKQKKTVFEIITLASLLEKEVPNSRDRKIVAGILWKRLANHIPLQVDATVSYATGKRGTPSARDLLANSPYNTYAHSGLPPGPIANPGLDAVRAAIQPTPNPYLYYLSTADGTTIFSKTLTEHAAAKTKYLGR